MTSAPLPRTTDAIGIPTSSPRRPYSGGFYPTVWHLISAQLFLTVAIVTSDRHVGDGTFTPTSSGNVTLLAGTFHCAPATLEQNEPHDIAVVSRRRRRALRRRAPDSRPGESRQGASSAVGTEVTRSSTGQADPSFLIMTSDSSLRRRSMRSTRGTCGSRRTPQPEMAARATATPEARTSSVPARPRRT